MEKTQYFQPWIRFSFDWWGGNVTHWVLRYHGGFSNDPDSYKNNESIYDTNLVIYHKSTPWEGPILEVITQDMAMPNKSFEERVTWGSPPCAIANWSTSGGGWQEPRCDVNGNGVVDLGDVGKIILIYSGVITHPVLVARADVNCDGVVDLGDVGTAQLEYSGIRFWPSPVDGLYTWFTSGGGDYQMWQELDNNTRQAIAGHTVMFSFWFYPESVTSDGSQNNARAEIYYEYDGGNNTINGVWIGPTEPGWWNAYAIVSLPSNTIAVKVVIHGTPNFKAWVDLAQLYLIQ